MQRYLGALTREIEGSPGGSTDTIYFGGGTPSLVPPPHIGDLIRPPRDGLAMTPADNTDWFLVLQGEWV